MNQAEANRLADLYNQFVDWSINQCDRGFSIAFRHCAKHIEKVLEDNGYELS